MFTGRRSFLERRHYVQNMVCQLAARAMLTTGCDPLGHIGQTAATQQIRPMRERDFFPILATGLGNLDDTGEMIRIRDAQRAFRAFGWLVIFRSAKLMQVEPVTRLTGPSRLINAVM